MSELISYTSAGGNVAALLMYRIDAAAEGLTVGSIYTFQFRSANSVGFSKLSKFLRVGLGR